MIIKNNTPKEKTLYYKVNGVTHHVRIPAFGESIDLPDLTSENQIKFNTQQRRLRHIEEKLGKTFKNVFLIPSDAQFTKYALTSAVVGNYTGTFSPSSASIAEGEDITIAITMPESSRVIIITESTSTLGTISPIGPVTVTSVPSLLTFTDNSVDKTGSLVYESNTSSAYTISNIAAAHALSASFNVITTAQTFSMNSTTVNIPLTVTSTGGTISTHSGQTSATTSTYLNVFSFNGSSFLNSVTGNLSGSSSCVISGITAYTNTLTVGYGYAQTAVTITMSASTNPQTPLKTFTVNGVSKFSDVTGAISGASQYVLTLTGATPQIIQALFSA